MLGMPSEHGGITVMAIRPSSVVDAITNSSSEAFVVPGGGTLEEVRQLVFSIFETAWEHYTAQDEGFRGEYDYYQFSRGGSPHGLYEVFEATERMEWFGRTVYLPGDIVVESTGDNSIPSELFDELECLLGADRHHLG